MASDRRFRGRIIGNNSVRAQRFRRDRRILNRGLLRMGIETRNNVRGSRLRVYFARTRRPGGQSENPTTFSAR